MDNTILNFPHLGEKIFSNLNDGDIAKCREVSKLWCNFLDHQKFWAIRFIKAKILKIHTIEPGKWTPEHLVPFPDSSNHSKT